MARTFIHYEQGKGFEINEAFFQLAIYYIYTEVKKSQYIFSNKQEFLEDFEDKINGIQNGWMVLGWYDDVITSPTEVQIMLQVLQNMKSALQGKGAYISVAELQSIPSDDFGFKTLYSRNPFPSAELIKIINALIKMLQGTWDSTNYSMDINYQY